MWNIKATKTTSIVSIGSVLFLSAGFMYVGYTTYQEVLTSERQAAALALTIPKPTPNLFKDITLEAHAAYVYDVNSKRVLYEYNADSVLPLASITKVMTALVAEEESQEGSQVTIDTNALATDGESGLREGETWSLKKILSFMLINSSNDGAAAVASAIGGTDFISFMNRKANDLGLTSLTFNNPTGLDIEETGETGGRGSAKDVAKMFEYVITKHPDLLEPTKYAAKEFSSDTNLHLAENTNPLTNQIPNILASKTGYTLQAGGNLAMAFDRGLNEPVIIVVLGSSFDGRFSDMLRLASTTLETYNQN